MYNFILEVKNITKYFSGICALDKVEFGLKKNEILGLVGDNGAGKSTLVKIISGVLQKDEGDIYFEGRRVKIENPIDAKKLGIETVYQDLALVDLLTVPENIFLGRELQVFGMLKKKNMLKESKKLLKKLGIDLENLNNPIMYYSGGQRQSVALSKIVYWGTKIAILDEPTAALGVKESNKALKLIKSLKENGLSVIIISHNLQHIFSIVDRIMVLRRGKRVDIVNAHEVTADDIVKKITGSELVEKV
jgi:ABC-type sugar transport system ATPase subunit